MTKEEKIKAAFDTNRNPRSLSRDLAYALYRKGYLAAIEDIKAKGPSLYMYQHDETGRTTHRNPDERMNERRWFEFPLYRLED